jgi:flagellar basal body-associated protein FliL
VKGIRVVSIVAFVIVTFISMGLVSALTSSDATILASLSNASPKPGDTVLVSVTFQSKVAQELQIYAIGVHADWMEADQLFGPNLSSNPATVDANGVYATQFTMQIPSSASLGTHTYRIGVDGLDSTGTAFSFDSADSSLQVVAGSSGTNNPTNGGDSGGQIGDWLPWVTVAAAAVIVAVLVVFFLMKSKKPRKPATQAPTESPVTPSTDEEPQVEQKPENENFEI